MAHAIRRDSQEEDLDENIPFNGSIFITLIGAGAKIGMITNLEVAFAYKGIDMVLIKMPRDGAIELWLACGVPETDETTEAFRDIADHFRNPPPERRLLTATIGQLLGIGGIVSTGADGRRRTFTAEERDLLGAFANTKVLYSPEALPLTTPPFSRKDTLRLAPSQGGILRAPEGKVSREVRGREFRVGDATLIVLYQNPFSPT